MTFVHHDWSAILPRYDNLILYPDLTEDDWKAMRSSGVGGTDLGAILGLYPATWNKTSLRTAQVKRGEVVDEFDEDSDWKMAFGKHNEHLILSKWCKWFGAELIYHVPFMRDKDRPWLVGSLDGIARLPNGELAVVDAKTSSYSWDDEAPVYYQAQLIHYMALTGIHNGYIICSFRADKPMAFQVQWDEDTAAACQRKAGEWWQRHVVEGIDPEPTTDDERIAVYTERLRGKSLAVQATEEQMALVALIEQVVDEEKAAKARATELKAKMLEAMVCMGASKIEWAGGSASITERKGNIGWKDYAASLGGSEEAADAAGFRGEPSRFVTIRRKGAKKEG